MYVIYPFASVATAAGLNATFCRRLTAASESDSVLNGSIRFMDEVLVRCFVGVDSEA